MHFDDSYLRSQLKLTKLPSPARLSPGILTLFERKKFWKSGVVHDTAENQANGFDAGVLLFAESRTAYSEKFCRARQTTFPEFGETPGASRSYAAPFEL